MIINASIYQLLGTSEAAVKGRSRVQDIQIARMVLFYYLRQQGHTLGAIGREFNRTHATVLNAVRNVEKAIAVNDSRVTKMLRLIENENNVMIRQCADVLMRQCADVLMGKDVCGAAAQYVFDNFYQDTVWAEETKAAFIAGVEWAKKLITYK